MPDLLMLILCLQFRRASTVPLASSVGAPDDCQGAVYEISDGQIQAPYPAPASIESGSGWISVATLATRDTQSSSTPSSTTSAFVVASHLGASFGSISSPTTFPTDTWPVTEPVSASSPTASPSAVPTSLLTGLTTSAVQSATAPPPTNTSVIVHTTLERSGEPSSQPFPTVSINRSRTLSLVDTSTIGSIVPTATANVTDLHANNIFQPIATSAPPGQIPVRLDHPVPRLGIQPQEQKPETNKFYANFFLGDQTEGTWTHPYSVSWCKGAGQPNSWGIAVSHVERDQLGTGPKTSSDAGDWAYFANPIGMRSLVLSATELGIGTTLTTDTLEAFSVNVNLVAAGATSPTITFPLVQGMGFVTGIYDNGTPLLQSGVGFQNLTYAGSIMNGTTYKYSALLQNGFAWLIYVTPSNDGYQSNLFTLMNAVSIQGAPGFSGYVQVSKIPADTPDAETVYDGSAGAYADAVNISGSVDSTTGTYSFSWTRQGPDSQPLLIFALPHHLQSFSYQTLAGITDIKLITTTKGIGTAVRGDTWTLIEPYLPIDMSFEPWSPSQGSIDSFPLSVISAINTAGSIELAENIAQQTNTGSIYYDGKALAKFAAIVYVVHQLAHNTTLALTGLLELESAFELHVNNQQTSSLVYDSVWGGVVTLSSYVDGNAGDDFGNTYYNDHHFHYGYFLYTAAVIGYLDPSWLEQGTNKAWVNMLARDFANPIVDDPYFPFSRMFDWYMGHSWAEGLFASADGKNQESSSEDTMASYGIKMWGKTIGDKSMEARGNLMLAIQARSLSNYFLYLDNNTVEPPEFIGNKVSGILFENKIDHTTYFGNRIEYIEGIHMLPLIPMSTLIRGQEFVSQEWTAYDFGSYVDQVQGGWRGVLMANLAIIDPVTSYNFFSNSTGDFQLNMLDGGASQTWYLAWSAALGGAAYNQKGRRKE